MDILLAALFYMLFFFIVYKIYYLFKGRKNKEQLFRVVEIVYLSNKYKINIKKIGIKKMLNIVALSDSIILTIALITTSSINNIILHLLVMFIMVLPLIYLVYLGIGKFYQKRS